LIYEFRLTVPANTPKTAPKRLELRLTAGVITWLQWFWPPGTHQLGHARVLHHGRQLWPDAVSDDLTDDGHAPAMQEHYRLTRPYRLLLEAWNEDDTYQHTFTLRFNLLPEEVMPVTHETFKPFLQALRRLAELLEAMFRPRRRRS